VFAWNALEVLAFVTGNPAYPVNRDSAARIGAHAASLRRGLFAGHVRAALRAHPGGARLRQRRCGRVARRHHARDSTRPHSSVGHARRAVDRGDDGAPPAILPNLGGSLRTIASPTCSALPTVWVPHSYPACSQHAPNEHMLASVAREGLAIMTGVFWDIGS
jgi:hypothetical protein